MVFREETPFMTVTPEPALPQDVRSKQSRTAVRAADTIRFLIVFGVILIIFGTFRNFKIEFDSAPDVFNAVSAAVVSHNALYYGQPEAEAVGVPVMRLVGSVEAVPDFGYILRGDKVYTATGAEIK